MPQLAHKIKTNNPYANPYAPSYVQSPVKLRPVKPVKKTVKVKKQKKVKKTNPFRTFVSLVFLSMIATFVMPKAFHDISLPLLTGKQNYANVKADYYNMVFPTTKYLSNTINHNRRAFAYTETKSPLMTPIYKTQELLMLKGGLVQLSEKYPELTSAITVWDFYTGKYVDINGSEIFPSASIIKVPVLIHLFKMIEANNLSIYDEMYLTPYYKASGSGNLQYEMDGKRFTINQLAKTMIQDSDNSATNMLMAKLGSMTAVNSAIRSWGIKNTYVQTWLPDLQGTNYTTTNDLATMLFNLDNPSFLNINSREYIVDYMSHVKNDRLIPQGLGKGATFLHKTGDIGTMLGDAGIVYMPNGRKYIVAIMVKRPFNSPRAKEYIKEASKLIYNSMLTVE